MDINTGTLPVDYLHEQRGVEDLVTVSERARLCKELLGKLPSNDFGLPVGIYRPDLLPQLDPDTDAYGGEYSDGSESLGPTDSSVAKTEQSLFIGDVLGEGEDASGVVSDLVPRQRSLADQLPHSTLQAAYVPLSYDEGYPTLPQGMPVWGQFPFEPPAAYEAFQKYLEMSHKSGLGVRMLSELPKFANSYAVQITMSDVHEFYYLYYWGIRAKAFDMFQTASLQKQQELRALQVVDTHYKMTDKLMERLEEFMNDDEDFWDMMTPKTAVDMLKAITAIQRTSVGLPAAGPAQHKSGEDPRGSSLEFIMRQVAQKTTSQHEGELLQENGNILNDILEDPEMTSVAQELILRLNKHG